MGSGLYRRSWTLLPTPFIGAQRLSELPLSCVTVCHHISTGLYRSLSAQRLSERTVFGKKNYNGAFKTATHHLGRPRQRSRCNDSLRAGQFGSRTPSWREFTHPSITPPRPAHSSTKWVPAFSRKYSRRGGAFTTHPYLVPRLQCRVYIYDLWCRARSLLSPLRLPGLLKENFKFIFTF